MKVQHNQYNSSACTSSCADNPWKEISKNESFDNKLVTRKAFAHNPIMQFNGKRLRKKAEHSMISKLFISDRMIGATATMISFFNSWYPSIAFLTPY